MAFIFLGAFARAAAGIRHRVIHGLYVVRVRNKAVIASIGPRLVKASV